ncbi:MAG: hypothetical protein KUL75_01770 [Sterolibacterium sp.]|nr:hypothetical protein [Sterolibacterium sp.]
MKSSQILIGTTLGLVLLGGIGIALWQTTPSTNLPAASSSSSADHAISATLESPGQPAPLPSVPHNPLPADTSALANTPWAVTAPTEPEPPSPTTASGTTIRPNNSRFDASQDANGKKFSAEELQRRATDLTAGGRQPSPSEVDQLLADIQRSQGKNEVGGVDLAAVRANLAHATEIQRLALEIRRVAEQPGKPDISRIQILMGQIQQQQAGIRADVRADTHAPLGQSLSSDKLNGQP